MTIRNWSGPYWKFYETVADRYPIEPTKRHKKAMLDVLYAGVTLINCPTCRDGWRTILTNRPPDVSSRIGLQRWLYQARNDVNNRVRAKFRRNPEHYKERYGLTPWAGLHDNPTFEEAMRGRVIR